LLWIYAQDQSLINLLFPIGEIIFLTARLINR
jgi:hypothetical protein